jgi:hypothetical protein
LMRFGVIGKRCAGARPTQWLPRDFIADVNGKALACCANAIDDVLTGAGISYRKAWRAKRLPGFDQTPYFVIPSEINPQVVVEAKLTQCDRTARDKVTRVQHLGALSMAGQPPDQPKFEVVACIAGCGYGVRRDDMKRLILATRGKVFTLQNIQHPIQATRLR